MAGFQLLGFGGVGYGTDAGLLCLGLGIQIEGLGFHASSSENSSGTQRGSGKLPRLGGIGCVLWRT